MSDLPSALSVNYSAPPPRGGKTWTRCVAWGVIIAAIITSSWSNWRSARPSRRANAYSGVDATVQITGRYAVGAHALLSDESSAALANSLMVAQLDKISASPADKLAAAVVVAELQGSGPALKRLDALAPATPAPLQEDLKALRQIYSAGGAATQPASPTPRLSGQLGWFAGLARVHGLSSSDPRRQAVLASARRTTTVFATAAIAGGFGLVIGVVLLLILLVRFVDGKLPMHFRPPGYDTPFLEAFAVYVGGIVFVSQLGHLFPALGRLPMFFRINLMFVPTVVAIFWPLWRGVGATAWRQGLGWHRGRGLLKEIVLGLGGYIAGLPIIGGGLLVTILLIKLADANPTHPIQRMIGTSTSNTLFLYFMASLYAPLTEETMFRGALFSSLRSRRGWIVSTLVTSFIFASVHPQGWTVVPALMSIAVVLAGIREWRSTMFASAAAHGLHNGILVTLMTLAVT